LRAEDQTAPLSLVEARLAMSSPVNRTGPPRHQTETRPERAGHTEQLS
jgi:hypothetical protein